MKIILISFLIFIIHVSLSAQDGIQKEYYPNGKLKSEINYYSGVREGEAKFYYENGNLKEERFYLNGKAEGLVRYYNENGKLIEMATLENGKRQGPTSIFDSTGVFVMDIYYEDGKKVVETSHYYDQKPIEITAQNTSAAPETKEEQKSAVVIKNKQVNHTMPPRIEEESDEVDPAFYLTVEVMPEPVGGPDQIQKKVYYPPYAKENGIQGTVKILTFIDEYGEVKKAEVVEGIGYGCDESARIAVYYTKFKPGLQRGKPVKVQMTIPVEFKIN